MGAQEVVRPPVGRIVRISESISDLNISESVRLHGYEECQALAGGRVDECVFSIFVR